MKQLKASLQAAVEILVTDGPIKLRLARAYESHLEEFAETDLPASIRENFCKLHSALHKGNPIGRQNALHATIAKMSATEVSSHCVGILAMLVAVNQQKKRTDPIRMSEEQTTGGSLQVTESLKFADRSAVASPR